MTRPLKTKLATLDQLDGRTIAAKQARALMADIESDLGGRDELSTAEFQLIQTRGHYRRHHRRHGSGLARWRPDRCADLYRARQRAAPIP